MKRCWEFPFWEGMQQNWSFIFESPILRDNQGTIWKNGNSPEKNNTLFLLTYSTGEKTAILPNTTHLVPAHAWEGAFSFRVSPLLSHPPITEPWDVSLCCAARMLLLQTHTGQVSAHSAGYFQFHLHRALLPITGNQGMRTQSSLWLRITILGHPVDLAVRGTLKRPQCILKTAPELA